MNNTFQLRNIANPNKTNNIFLLLFCAFLFAFNKNTFHWITVVFTWLDFYLKMWKGSIPTTDPSPKAIDNIFNYLFMNGLLSKNEH